MSEGASQQQPWPVIVKYTGSLVSPEWEDVDEDKFEMLCHVEADISTAPYTSKKTKGKRAYLREFDVILLVGLTELKAQVSWIDSATGIEKRSPAVVVYGNSEEI